MKKLKSAGTCPKCGDDLAIFVSKSRKRWVECDACGLSYAIPKYGKISKSGFACPKDSKPLLIIEKGQGGRSSSRKIIYFWAGEPCFQCSKRGSCEPVLELREEYEIDSNLDKLKRKSALVNSNSGDEMEDLQNRDTGSRIETKTKQEIDIYQRRILARQKRMEKLKAAKVISD